MRRRARAGAATADTPSLPTQARLFKKGLLIARGGSADANPAALPEGKRALVSVY